MKRILAILVALSLLILAIPAQADATVKLVFWHSFSEGNAAVLQQLVENYNANEGAAAGIEIEAVYQGSYAEATQKLNGILLSGELSALPDVMMMDATGKVTYANSNIAYSAADAMADHPDFDASVML